MKKSNLMIVIVFIFFLLGPNIIYWFIKDRMDNKNYENRELYVKPKFNLNTITLYPNNYENYFNDHLAFKNEIRKVRSSINYKLFHVSSNNRVIVGEDGWLFYNSDGANDGITISELRHINEHDDKEISEIKNKIITTKNKLKEKDIDLYVWVISNKEDVYSEYLPKAININKSGYENRVEKLIKNGNEAEIIYVKDELLNGKKKYNTYYKYDTHWNDYGAYLGVKKLMSNIDSNYQMSDVKIDYVQHGGDLARMNLMHNLANKEPTNVGFLEGVSANCKNKENIKICSSNGTNSDTILVIGDSFREASVQYLSKVYKKSIFIHRDIFKKSFIKKYNPDIIVYESVERYAGCLENIDVLIK